MKPPARVRVAGIGGFAREHHRALQKLERTNRVVLRSACDPSAPQLAQERKEFSFASRGVDVFLDFREMMDAAVEGFEGSDWVSIATPIPLHPAMHQLCVERGAACYLEKPPTLDPAQLEEMIQTDRRAKFRTQVGFNYIHQPARLELKRRLLEGDFGVLRHVAFIGAWKRTVGYFARHKWAGRVALDGRPVLDSCLGNGMSHHIHNLLFLSGQNDLYEWGRCTGLESEFYRVNQIEGPDTVFVRGTIGHETAFHFALTNACEGPDVTVEQLDCDQARIRIHPHEGIEIRWHDGRFEHHPLPSASLLEDNFSLFLDYLEGSRERPATLLEDSRPLVHLNAMAFHASPEVFPVAESYSGITRGQTSSEDVHFICDIRRHLDAFVENGRFPSESECPWGRRGGSAVPADLTQITVPLDLAVP
jgi:predicted dehydrogenase